jgi:hypothetical protein
MIFGANPRCWFMVEHGVTVLLPYCKKKNPKFEKQTAHSAFQNTHKNRGKISLENIPSGYATKIAIV